MENHAHKLIFVGWQKDGARIYAMGKVPESMQGTGYVATDEEVAADVKRLQDKLVSEGGMLNDGSGWKGPRVPFTDKYPDYFKPTLEAWKQCSM